MCLDAAICFLESIYKEGIKSESRLYVHLSPNVEIAQKVGSRHGTPYVLGIGCKSMVADGIKFYLSNNGVWLTHYVAPKYLKQVWYAGMLTEPNREKSGVAKKTGTFEQSIECTTNIIICTLKSAYYYPWCTFQGTFRHYFTRNI